MKEVFSNLLFTLLLIFTIQVKAQNNNLVIVPGVKQTIRSSVLKESRKLSIYTPGKVKTKLPLILVFDGDALFSATVSAIRFMNYNSEIPQMPEALVIGIENTERNRDMPIPQQYGEEKGEDNFMKFVKEELIPWANNNFSLNGHTIAIGHSQGGYFVSYLLSKSPEKFPWILSLDAPMNIGSKSVSMKEEIAKAVKDTKIRYASIEAVYGWRDEWSKYFLISDNVLAKRIFDESHESMVFVGVYEGLKFLYKDFSPPRKDMNLSALSKYYDLIHSKYDYIYEIPLSVLLASASRKIPENRKHEALELLDYAESRYGQNDKVKELRSRAAVLGNETISIVDSFLSLPAPSPANAQKYIGKWSGQFFTKEDQSFACDIEIKRENDNVKLVTAFDPHNRDITEEAEVFHISKDDKLIFGKRNRGGGIIINTLSLDKSGNLMGEGRWIGFTIPADAPEDQKRQLSFLLTKPTKYFLEKQ